MSITVVRAEDFYLPPPELPPDSWALVQPAERVWRWVEYKQQRRVTPPEGFLIGVQLWARINHNRWLVDCPCGSAQVVTPADPRFACTECGYGWVALVFPADPAAVEAAIEGALPHERNWVSDEAPPPARAVQPSPPRKGAR